MRIIAVIIIAVGVVLSGIGISMRTKQNAFTSLETEVKQGNKVTSAAIGAGVGAAVGGGAGALLGGIGIAACGTGIGIPAGAVCLLCAGACSLICGASGYIAGRPDTITAKPVVELVNAYSPYEYLTVIIAGCLLVVIGIVCFSRTIKWHTDEGCLTDK